MLIGRIVVAMFLGFSIAAAVPVAWYFFRSDAATEEKVTRPAKRTASKPTEVRQGRRRNFKGASVYPGEDCCQAVREFGNTRFLVEAAPRLPLEGCDRISECVCKYNNHPDRRSAEDRRNVFGSLSTSGEIGMRSDNKRSGMDRRADMGEQLDGIEFETDIENY